MAGSAPAKERILDAAAGLIASGDGTVEMAALAESAGVSTGLAYHYFGSKAGVLAAVVNSFYDRYEEVANMRMDGSRPWPEREKERLRRVIAHLYEEPLAPAVFGLMGRSAEVAKMEMERQAAISALAALNVEQGQRQGFIPKDVDARIAGAAMMGGLRLATAAALSSDPRPDKEILAAHLWSFIAGAVRLRREPV